MMRLVYFSPVPWASFAQRPHRFVEWFQSRSRANVLWIDPYPTRLPVCGDLRRIRIKGGKAERDKKVSTPEWLKVVCPRALPIEPLPGGSLLNGLLWQNIFKEIEKFLATGRCMIGIGKPSEMAMQALRRYQCESSFFDVMDDFPLFYKGLSRTAMRRRERKIASVVSRLLVSSTILTGRFSAHSSKTSVVLNACTVDSLPLADSTSKKSIRPILGYVGTIGYWFDWPMVLALAAAFPSMLIRLIGPVYVMPKEPLPSNVELLPACDHATAISAMREFSAGLIPFRRNALTASVDPIKYYEYRAFGLPVISTRFGEMAMRDDQPGVFIVDTHSDFTRIVKAALLHEFEMGEVQQFRIANSWNKRFDGCGILD